MIEIYVHLLFIFFQLSQALGNMFSDVSQSVCAHLRVQTHVRVRLHALGRQTNGNRRRKFSQNCFGRQEIRIKIGGRRCRYARTQRRRRRLVNEESGKIVSRWRRRSGLIRRRHRVCNRAAALLLELLLSVALSSSRTSVHRSLILFFWAVQIILEIGNSFAQCLGDELGCIFLNIDDKFLFRVFHFNGGRFYEGKGGRRLRPFRREGSLFGFAFFQFLFSLLLSHSHQSFESLSLLSPLLS